MSNVCWSGVSRASYAMPGTDIDYTATRRCISTVSSRSAPSSRYQNAPHQIPQIKIAVELEPYSPFFSRLISATLPLRPVKRYPGTHVLSGTKLCKCYADSGTERAYGVAQEMISKVRYATCLRLRARYAMSSTDIRNAPPSATPKGV
eukprot:382093-Rhodomonas_salina.1